MPLARTALASIVVCLAAASSCSSSSSSSTSALAIPDGCQPLLGGYDCFLPYPSDFFRVPDAKMESGFRIAPSGAAKLTNKSDVSADVTEWHAIDGYSRVPTIVAVLPSDIAKSGFVGLLDSPDSSKQPSSAALLVDAETGELVPHYVDLDARATDPTRRAITIHPLVALKPSARYVVAIHGAMTSDGKPAKAAEGFRRLRDHAAGGDPALAAMAARYESDVFQVLDKVGVARKDLQLAWDFTTSSGKPAVADMLHVRELTMAWLMSNKPTIAVTKITPTPAPNIWREIQGTITGPLFLDKPDAGAALARDASGAVVQNGSATFPFTIHVPLSVRDQFGPGRALAYGHGFFGSQAEAEGTSARKIADTLHAVTFAIDWWGMSKEDDGIVVGDILSNPSRVAEFSDRVHQAMANWIVTTAAIKTAFHDVPELHRPTDPSAPGVGKDANGNSNAGALVFDDAQIFYFGASQGHILGGTQAALNPYFTRVVLNVGGAGLTHAMSRAMPFAPMLGMVGVSIPDPLDQQKYMASMQPELDRIDPASYADFVLAHKLPGSPDDRRVLMQIGLGDAEVPNLASWLHARMLGLGEITPNAYAVWGLPQVAPPQSTSALTVFDFGIDLNVYKDGIAPTDNNPVHEGVRIDANALKQMDQFFTDGTIVNPCGGVCRAN